MRTTTGPLAPDTDPALLAQDVGRFVLRVVLPLTGFWAVTALVGLADYENGLERAVSLLVLGAGVVLLPLTAVQWRRALVVVLALALLCLAGYRVHQAETAVEQGRGPTIDIGTTTIAAVELALDGRSPYTERIDFFGDQVRPGGTGLDHFAGFKYGPIMTAAYLPGVRADGAAGYFRTSLVALLLLAAAAGAWGWQAGGAAAGTGAAALVLTTAFLDGELFHAGVNDVVPMALLVGAFAVRARGGGVAAGVLLGLSFGAKLLPAALLALPLLLSRRTGRLPLAVVATLVGAAAYLPPLLSTPRELVSNLLLFNLARPGDRTGLLDGIPESLRPYLLVLLVALIALVLLLVLRTAGEGEEPRRAQAQVAALSAVTVALLYASSPVLHRNWLIWIVPFLAVAVALKAWGQERTDQKNG